VRSPSGVPPGLVEQAEPQPQLVLDRDGIKALIEVLLAHRSLPTNAVIGAWSARWR
jgi:hypothetical protein